MKHVFILRSLFCLQAIIPLAGFSQNQHALDSMVNVLKTEKADTYKVKTLYNIGRLLLNNNPDKSFEYTQQSLALAQKHNLRQYIIYNYQNIAGYYYYKNDYNNSLNYTLKALAIAKQINNKSQLCSLYDNLTTLSMSEENFQNSLAFSDTALQIAEELKDTALQSRILGAKGRVYIMIDDYTSALKYFFGALKMAEAQNNKSELVDCYSSISTIYYAGYKNFDKALYYSLASLNMVKQMNSKRSMGAALRQTGEIYQSKEDLDKAIDYFKQALSINEEVKNQTGIADCNRDLALVYSEQKKFNLAEPAIAEAVRISEQIGSKNEMSINYGCSGGIYLRQKEYRKAISYLNKSLAVGKTEPGGKNNLSNTLKDLAESYEGLHNSDLAATYWKQYAVLKDSMLNEEEIKKTAEMEARYNADKKEKEIALLTKDKQIQKLEIKKQDFLINSFVIGIALFFILLFFVYRSYHTRQLLKLQTLRTKIASDLHDDIGSTLSSISIFTQMVGRESKDILPKLDQIGEYCRKMLDSMADIVWTINPENDNFEKIIFRMRSFAFELLRSKNIDFEFNADDLVSNMKLSMEVRKNLYLIFKEATNNMAKYSDANRASVLFTGSGSNLFMLIRDNGKGFDTSQQTDGNGLKNIRNRAMEIGAKLLIESEPGKGTTIQLSIKPS